MHERNSVRHKHVTSFQIIILGFLSVIILGSLLLMLPFATRDGKGAGLSDALFTATSAVCVTGLVVQDTAIYWSAFGQAAILCMIQIGGMGIVTVAVSFAMLSGRKISLMQRSTMQESVAAHHVGGIVRLTKFIIRITAFIEIAGAVLLSPFFIRDFGVAKGIWYSVFHSVSAFCNAGFDLIGVKSPYASLIPYYNQPLFICTIMALIVIGGLGFLTWEDIKKNKFRLRRYRMQSKVILAVTAGLIVLPTIYFFFFEYSELPAGERLLSALFQAVTPRTAGFCSTDLTHFSETGQAVMIILMIIGGSPGSTAGGMKTTTFAVLFAFAVSVFRKKENAQMFKRRMPDETIKTAATILIMYCVLFVSGGMIISRLENLPLLSCMFETASAIGTVGLSLGVTAQLGAISRLILIMLMFCGRVGGLTLIFAAVTGARKNASKYPQEKITVG